MLWKMHGQSKCLGICPPNQEVYNSPQIFMLMPLPANLHLHPSHMQYFYKKNHIDSTIQLNFLLRPNLWFHLLQIALL